MKKIVVVNNNMHVGGVQKSLLEFLKEIHKDYDITLILFAKKGDLLPLIPSDVKVIETKSLYHCLGLSQYECKNIFLYFLRAILVVLFRVLGRHIVMPLINIFQPKLKDNYDVAISFFQNANEHLLYGGCNDFVLHKIDALKKITFLHCDYRNCGSNIKHNNEQYFHFDKIATCSEGCKKSFLSILPELDHKTFTVVNCHDYEQIKSLSMLNSVEYPANYINMISIARLAEEKGIDRGIKAVAKNENIMYHIVGDGPQYQFLVDLVKQLKIEHRVKFYGKQVNPYRYMRNADLLLIPSIHEAAPLVIDEARCLNLPIASTNTISSYDMIVSKSCGWICSNNQDGLDKFISSLSKIEILNKKKLMSKLNVNNDLFKKQFAKIIN